MEILGLFLVGFLLVAFPKQGWKVVRIFLGIGVLFACLLLVVAYFCSVERQRSDAEFAEHYHLEQAQKAEKFAQEHAYEQTEEQARKELMAWHPPAPKPSPAYEIAPYSLISRYTR